MAKHNILGKIGEDAACNYLASQGYAIVERNVSIGHLELDIVAMDGTTMVFVEVKTRTSDSGLSGIEGMTRNKMHLLIRAADAYVKSHDIPFEVRFDICLVMADRNGAITGIEHIRDAFYPPI
ncbi:YraN family protein [uncultured Muribaculum sp.]|uniref:YraN family protein n=1 Tax=uncultured Muribaculum sp. TaxID=1918613 RepID=UPI0025F8C6D9|nr:YraN family protein [uncultured Muribaculum sp.]